VVLGGSWRNDRFILDRNLYWDYRAAATPDDLSFAGGTFDQWRKRGHDMHSLFADPLFIAPEQDDFRLLPASPAFRLGFQPIEISRVGPRGAPGSGE